MKMNKKHEAFTHKVPPQLYKIGMFAQMNHITVKALRFYEEQGLLHPAHVDSENGYRYYTMNQMAEIQRITALKQAGFTLEEIKLINQGADAASLLASKKAALLKKIAELTSQIAVIDGYLSGPANALDTPVLIRKIPAVIVSTQKSCEPPSSYISLASRFDRHSTSTQSPSFTSITPISVGCSAVRNPFPALS